MTIATEKRIDGPFVGNGSITQLAFEFKAFGTSEVYVLERDDTTGVDTILTLTTDYSVALNADQDTSPGGTVTLVTALATGKTAYVGSAASAFQLAVFTNTGGFFPSVLNNSLDRLHILHLEQEEMLARAVTTRVGEQAFTIEALADGQVLARVGTKLTGVSNDFAAAASSAASAAASNAAAVNSASAAAASAASAAASAAAASNPDANTAAALAASQQALDANAALFGALDPTSSAAPAALVSRVKTVFFQHAKNRDYDVRLYRFNSTAVELVFRDEVTEDEMGRVLISTPADDYSSLPGKRWPILAQDHLSATPVGDPDGANATGILGYVEFFDSVAVLDAGTYQPAVGAARINRRNVIKRRVSVAKHIADDFDEVIEVGPNRTLTSPRAGCDLLLDAPQPTDQTSLYQPECVRSINNRIAIVIDPANSAVPGEPWEDRHLFVPPGVSLVARHPNSVFFEHSAGSTRPIIQLTGSHDLIDINIKNTVADSPISATSSACYGLHLENVNSRLTEYPQGEDNDYEAHFVVRMIGGSLTAGSAATTQPFGGALPANTLFDMYRVDLDMDDPSKAFPLVSMNNSSLLVGGGRMRIAQCRDLSGRDQSNPLNVANATVAVQSKGTTPYPNLLELESNLGFGKIAYTGTGEDQDGGPNAWKLQGGDWQGVLVSTLPGDNMGYAAL